MVCFTMFSLNNGLKTFEAHLIELSFDQTCQC
jgi:hypothetical protein